MCKSVRDADRLDSLKPDYTVNDVSSEIDIKNGAVNVQCTRFKTRMRRSETQVRPIHYILPRRLICVSGCDGNTLLGYSTSS